jgi:hypothetical protein
MILSFMILSSQPGQNHEGQNHGDRIVRAPGISSPLANDFDCCSTEVKSFFLSASFAPLRFR